MDLKILKIKKTYKKKRPIICPSTGWKIILFFSFFLILLSCYFGFVLFKQIDKDFVVSVEEVEGQIKIVKKEKIQKTLEIFSERENKSAEIIVLPAPITDPSI